MCSSDLYQASFEGFAARGLSAAESESLMRDSVRIALRARERRLQTLSGDAAFPAPLVAASIGPFGAIRHDGSEFHGNYGLSEQELATFHERRLGVLADAGADLLACETIPSLLEARALAAVLRENSRAPAWISFSCKDGGHTCAGDPIADCAAFLDEQPAVFAVGVNCSAPESVEPLVQIGRAHV